MRIAHLGPRGTFSEEAATRHAPGASLLACPTITASAQAVRDGDAELAALPIENSLQGAVTETLDLLLHGEGLAITGEVVIPVVHDLMAAPGVALAQIQRVYSHPQALGQCKGYLTRALPGAELAPALSTAGAVEQAMHAEVTAAAIAPHRAAALYGAHILAEGIQDDDSNATRFVVVARQDAAPTGDDKTSIAFTFDEDKPGQLYGVMGEFANAGINLAKVESRPTRLGLGRYYFLIDVVGHRADPAVAAVLERVGARVSHLKVFGSYPRFAPGA
jgi:prephenate dehydratase